MKKYCKTNQLNIEFLFDEILNNFTIIRFSTTENYIKYGALILDEVNFQINARSIVFEKGKSFYALFNVEEIEGVDFAKKVQSLKGGDLLVYDIIKTKQEVKKIPQYLLAQLLMNSISSPSHKRLTFNNLSGKLYVFNPNHFKISTKRDKEQIFKIIGLEFKITESLLLELNVRTFSSLLLSKKMDFSQKPLSKHAKYTFVHSTNTLKRILNSDNIPFENQYILKQENKNKSFIPFLDFKNLEDFNKSKIGVLKTVLKAIDNKLSKYLKVTFNNQLIEKTIRYNNSDILKNVAFEVKIVDGIKDEDSKGKISILKEKIKECFPNISIKTSSKEDENCNNIKLIHNKEYYDKYDLKDVYSKNVSVQHITFQDFKNNSKASLKAIINELRIKNDIRNKKISIIDWAKYNFSNNWIFGSKINDNFYFLTITPKGIINFEAFEPNLFNQNEYDNLCSIFNKDPNIEYLIKDDGENICSIKRTKKYSLPEFDKISEILLKEKEKIKLTKQQAISYVESIFYDILKQKEIIKNIEIISDWSKVNLLNCFHNRNDKKIFTEKIKSESGEILKSYLRDKTRYEILDSQLDIHFFIEGSSQYYFVGIKGKGIQQQIARASIIRVIEPVDNSKLLFKNLLPLMNVDFVKNGDLTVTPFPLKYLREWVETLSLTA